MRFGLLFSVLSLTSASAFADANNSSSAASVFQQASSASSIVQSTNQSSQPAPWLTGPLIAPVGAVVPKGSIEIESYVYMTTNTGVYNSKWNVISNQNNFFLVNPQFLCFFGLTPWMDLNVVPQFFYNHIKNQSGVVLGDTQVAFDFQPLDPSATPYFPGIKLFIRETFPTGPYQHLNPSKLLTDQSGQGSFQTSFGLVLYKVYHLGGRFFLSTTIAGTYTVPSSVSVKGFNTYGGGYGTKGRVFPGNSFQGVVSFELSLSQNWVLAIDNVYQHTDANRFIGKPGTAVGGGVASVGGPSSEQISFAPAIEYNISSSLGVEVGCWFTAYGRNSTQFRSAVIAVDYTF